MASSAESTEPAPLFVLLSQVLIAFTIEFDNEFEYRMAAAGCRKFRLSMAMWSNFMRFVDERGITVRELEQKGGDLLSHMEWWRYVQVGPAPNDARLRPPKSQWIVEPTESGMMARELWPPLFDEIENRWVVRFGRTEIDELRTLLHRIVDTFEVEMPQYVPIVGYGLTAGRNRKGLLIRQPGDPSDPGERYLPALMSAIILDFANNFESESVLSLPICADIVRVIDGKSGTLVRDLPALGGISKEAVSMGIGFLSRHGFAEVGRGAAKTVSLMQSGIAAQDAYYTIVQSIEDRWNKFYGADTITGLRRCLESLLDREQDGKPLISQGLHPLPGCWRGERPYLTQTKAIIASPRKSLPYYPMVTHRGGWPDGS